MDAEKFDKVVLDLLYDELDELTRASAIRHTEQSGRAKALYSELRATREVGALPLVEPPADLEERILQAEERARAERPLGQRIGALVSIAASYAMRPQLAMAAVLLLMVGSSLLLLRAKPGAPSSVQITERGVPESEKESVTVPVAPAAPPSPEALEEPERSEAAERSRHAEAKTEEAPRPAATTVEGEKDKAEREFAEAPPPSPQVPAAAPADGLGLAAPGGLGAAGPAAGAAAETGAVAKADDESAAAHGSGSGSAGCETDLPRYEAIMASPGSSSAAALDAARFAAAQCYARLGRVEAARRTYRTLLANSTYAEASRRALSILPESSSRVADDANEARAHSAARAAPAKAAKPSTP